LSLQDFADGNVVHINSGIAYSVAALMIGRRHNFESVALTLHNMTMTSDAMLMLGWLDFCGGYALAITPCRWCLTHFLVPSVW